jgi:hypothetical protein
MVAGALLKIGCNDAILLLSIAYSSYDVICKWDEFHTCSKPIQWQLIVSYALVVMFRLTHFVGQHFAEDDEDFLLNFRHKKPVLRMIVHVTWMVTLPIFVAWTALGTVWLYHVFSKSPECLPAGTQPWFLVFWQVLSYLWIVVHVTFCVIAVDFERRIRNAESDARELETDGDVLQRWGRISELTHTSYGAVPWVKKRGLSASEIKKLPCVTHRGCAEECSICLNDIYDGDSARSLPGCGHSFHKACIDLWVLRCAECPLCKSEVTTTSSRATPLTALV